MSIYTVKRYEFHTQLRSREFEDLLNLRAELVRNDKRQVIACWLSELEMSTFLAVHIGLAPYVSNGTTEK